MDKWLEKLQVLLAKMKDDGQLAAENVELVDANIAEIAKATAVLGEAFGDGLQWSDITVLGEVVSPLMVLAANFDKAGEDKKAFVVDVVWLVYRTIDTWPDGKRNNINLPFVIGPLERRIERAVIAFAAGMAVDALYKRMKSDGEV